MNGTKHRKFAVKDSNFHELDLLLERIARRPIETSPDLYDDDDSGQYGEDANPGCELEEDVGDSSEDYGELLMPSLGYVSRNDRRVSWPER